jgi:hypothetical protein
MATFSIDALDAEEIVTDKFTEAVFGMLRIQEKIYSLFRKYESVENDDPKRGSYLKAGNQLQEWRDDESAKLEGYVADYLKGLKDGEVTKYLPKKDAIKKAVDYCVTRVKSDYCLFLANHPKVGKKCDPLKKRKRRKY